MSAFTQLGLIEIRDGGTLKIDPVAGPTLTNSGSTTAFGKPHGGRDRHHSDPGRHKRAGRGQADRKFGRLEADGDTDG